MWSRSFAHEPAVETLCRQVGEFVEAAEGCDDLQLLAPARCHGWSRLDVVVHVRSGLQEMALGTLVTSSLAPDHDAASYWSAHPDDRDRDPVPHILWLRRTAAAYGRPTSAVAHLREVAYAARGAVRAMPEATVTFQGKRLRSGDFLATWVVELAVHELDLDLDLDAGGSEHGEPDGDPDGRGREGLAWTRTTLEAVAGTQLPEGLDDRTAVLAGLGREPSPAGTPLQAPFPVSL
ncbi:maleylpyruvate isomerase N-terminal domain-containing protein [Terrabacter sp. NPDC080008]|uniref:maleylpyruvate isomerase N-terminal domain-containing protein n=1 Tax=Terrabacter sp. NPDC080008 TaxID=3155176 RepID=UPI00344B832B